MQLEVGLDALSHSGPHRTLWVMGRSGSWSTFPSMPPTPAARELSQLRSPWPRTRCWSGMCATGSPGLRSTSEPGLKPRRAARVRRAEAGGPQAHNPAYETRHTVQAGGETSVLIGERRRWRHQNETRTKETEHFQDTARAFPPLVVVTPWTPVKVK